MIWADLHCHTTCSDGTLTPTELVQRAKEIGLKGLSITDHDTVEAYPEALGAAKKAGIRLGTGVEFSCQFEKTSLHLLGYDFRLDHPAIRQLCEKHLRRRELRNRAILDKLKEHGIQISYDELKTSGKTVGRPHIAQLMVEKGAVKNFRAAFHDYIGEGKKCYVQGEAFQPKEAIDVIHLAGGKAFIAHPQLLPGNISVDRLLKLPFDGIECYYSRLFHRSWLEIAEARGWIVSGGSDFHGSVKPEIELGCSGVDQMTFERIFTHV